MLVSIEDVATHTCFSRFALVIQQRSQCICKWVVGSGQSSSMAREAARALALSDLPEMQRETHLSTFLNTSLTPGKTENGILGT